MLVRDLTMGTRFKYEGADYTYTAGSTSDLGGVEYRAIQTLERREPFFFRSDLELEEGAPPPPWNPDGPANA